MGFLHSSRPRGRVPQLLAAASDVRFLGFEGDGESATLLHFAVRTFEDVAPQVFEQRRLWDHGPQPHETAFELFGAALRDVHARRKDSDRYDLPFLRRITLYKRLLQRGVQSVDMPDTVAERRGHMDQEVIRAASDLVSVTPAARRVRVTGRVELIAVTPSILKLEVHPGELIAARWEGDGAIENLRELLNTLVVLEGTGVFRPSGTLLRVDADAVAPATAADEFFREVPVALAAPDYHKLARLKPGEKPAYARLRGAFRGEESDEEFEAALRALR